MNPDSLTWRTATIAITYWTVVALWPGPLAAEKPMFRASLDVRLRAHGAEYGDPNIAGQGMIFSGEPMVVEIGLISRLNGQPVGAEHDWYQRITATLYPGGRFEFKRAKGVPFRCTPESTWSNDVVNEADRVIIGGHGWLYIRCRADRGEYDLAPGRYTIEATYSDTADMKRFIKRNEIPREPSYLTGIFPFELRAVASEGDRLDLLNHLAAHAEADGRLDEALRLTDQGLARNPANLTALLTRRRVHAMQGLCELAAHDLELAAETVESGRDTGNHGPRLDPGARRANAEVFRRTMSAIRCP